MIYTPVQHQFSLFDYNQMRPTGKIRIKRISKERMQEAIFIMGKNPRPLLEVLRSINDDLERHENRLTNK
jgi:hypothetical protein